MGGSELSVVSTRSKREECTRTKHDSAFSEWKILVGNSDWEDYSGGKEGAQRYRTHNLPISSGPGLYELGIAVTHTSSGREVGKLEPDRIVVVYLGQADNVRTRLQHYGREGSHLGNRFLTGHANDYKNVCLQKGPGLFEEIFSRGFPIVFRWAPMKNKGDAEKTEARLLDTFDYAWNKGSNGARRPNDILQKLNKINSSKGTTRFPNIARRLQTFRQKQLGVRINASKPLLLENGPSNYTDEESNYLLSRVFKFGRSRPRLVLDGFGVNEDHTSICGVALGHGSICRRPPVEGRKRCAEHKGMKINGSISKLITEGKSHVGGVGLESGIISNPECDGHRAQNFSYNTVKPQLVAGKNPVDEEFTPICGVALDDGSPCMRQPVQGRKRCEEHKGRRIHGSISTSVTRGKSHHLRDVVLESGTQNDRDYEQNDTICGVDLGDGILCRRQPVVRRKRCEEHKGMRVNGSISKLVTEDKSRAFDMGSGFNICNDWKYNRTSTRSVSYRSAVNTDLSSICRVTLDNGSFCSRQPVEGRKRCWQHKGKRVDSSFSRFDNEGISLVCGVSLYNGNICTRIPVHGRKRCDQHKGMRVTTSYYL